MGGIAELLFYLRHGYSFGTMLNGLAAPPGPSCSISNGGAGRECAGGFHRCFLTRLALRAQLHGQRAGCAYKWCV